MKKQMQLFLPHLDMRLNNIQKKRDLVNRQDKLG